ncbi:MAG: HD superfamily phosphohydrolase [Myxococcota bacterium]|jgi:HD superfamily phosphohydrolase
MPITRLREIRDPIHGAIHIDAQESTVIDHPFFQRLRGIRQLGFSQIPFPGATHSRYAHSLGVMELAGQAFDAIFRDGPFSSRRRRMELRHCVRMAALCHDLGHGPFSHAAEFAMPPLPELGITIYDPRKATDRRASHEDYTIAILTRSSLAGVIAENFGFTPRHVASLMTPDVEIEDDFFFDRGYDLRGILSQLISSNLDADRLDYLVRDSYYTGASYGRIDVPWLVNHMGRHVDGEGRVNMALDRRALYAFDNFMVARYHMFLMVYFHAKSVAHELLLRRCLTEPDCDYRLPADMDGYLVADDAQLLSWMRGSGNPWAKRIVEQRPYKVAVELHAEPGETDLTMRLQALEEAGIDAMLDAAVGAVFEPSKPGKPVIYVTGDSSGRDGFTPLNEVSGSFHGARTRLCISRIFVPRGDLPRALAVLERIGTRADQQRIF